MDRRTFIASMTGGLLAAPLAAGAQPAGRIPRIGFLSPVEPAAIRSWFEAFGQGLRELGYVQGQNIAIEYRSADGRYERLPGLAAELVRLKVDVVVAGAPPAHVAAKQATSTIPIVFLLVGDPVGEGLVASLARPGGNMTGLTSIAPDVVSKQLELLKKTVSEITRVAILQNPGNSSHPLMLGQAEDAARALGVQLDTLKARSPAEIEAAFTAMISQRVGAVLILRDPLFFAQRTQIAVLAVKNRLPAVYGIRGEAEAGGLMAYGASNSDIYRRAAAYVDKILKGAKPGDLPIEQPTKFELVINLKTAKALGLTIPPSLLQRADQVIE
jgi:putative ABC transport system substrate-binding protein